MRQFAFNMGANKYKNKKVEVDGIVFDSSKEAKVYADLKVLKASGEIKDFARQVKFELIPNQYEDIQDEKGKTKKKLVERAVTYVADFVIDHNDGSKAVIDVKGYPDQKYGIKRKLMRYMHGIAIQEV
ncbi:MAG: hypothetical protein A4E65_02297 [Syntrophorhabdus sp. PtaU1.Bin153]|nr:MAG: hypothetical protein A4E65_02297 [Syntrophorhabdus sp. PtaU1.Bin153]